MTENSPEYQVHSAKQQRLRKHPCWGCDFLDEKTEKSEKAESTFYVPICTNQEENIFGLDSNIPVSRCRHYKDAETSDKTDKKKCPRCGRMAVEKDLFVIHIAASTGKTVMETGACLLCVERVPGWERVKWPPEE